MSRCIIIGAHLEGDLKDVVRVGPGDTVICADGGYAHAVRAGIRPDLVVGDFDSLTEEPDQAAEMIRVAAEKDDTDTMLCLKIGIQRGFNDFVLAGCLGGRLDHTVANLQALAYGRRQGKLVLLVDQNHLVTMIQNETVRLPRLEGYKLSLFSFSNRCTGVAAKGVKYPLENAELTNSFPLGISNEFLEEEAVITCGRGQMLIVLAREPQVTPDKAR